MNKYKDIVCSTQWRSKKWSITNKHPSAFISKSVVFHSIEFSFLTNSERSLWWTISSTLLYFQKYEFWKCKDIPNTRRYGQTEVFFGSAIIRVYFVVENFLQIYSFLAVHCTYPKFLNRSKHEENTRVRCPDQRRKKLKNVDLQQLSLWGNSM